MSDYENNRVIMESERINALDAYFNARPQLMRTVEKERIFESGFESAWNLRTAMQPSGQKVADEETTSPLAALILRDICELEPFDPEHEQAVCLHYDTLRLILNRNLNAAPSPAACQPELAQSESQLGLIDESERQDSPAAVEPDYASLLPQIEAILEGINKEDCEPNGWWETSKGVEFGESILTQIRELFNGNHTVESGVDGVTTFTLRVHNSAADAVEHELRKTTYTFKRVPTAAQQPEAKS